MGQAVAMKGGAAAMLVQEETVWGLTKLKGHDERFKRVWELSSPSMSQE